MKKFTVVWTWQANYSAMEILARSASEAAGFVCGHYGPEFQRTASVYAFESEGAYRSTPETRALGEPAAFTA